jgi:hypothetical protein
MTQKFVATYLHLKRVGFQFSEQILVGGPQERDFLRLREKKNVKKESQATGEGER